MRQITVDVRLRPVRFAFLVRPDDKDRTLQIFQINTCLWGGKYNPIIPFIRRVPSWWDRNGHLFDSAKKIVNGYLDQFEPDFLVEAEKGMADGLGFDPNRVIQLADVLPRAGNQIREGTGLCTFDLYKHLYETEYKFERRHKELITSIVPENPAYANFCACIFGGFPKQNNLAYLRNAYNDAFDPKDIALNAKELEKLYKSGFTSALRIGSSKLEVMHHDHSEPTIFVLDALEPRDLLDYWNLRIIQREIIAIPIQWINQLSELCKKLIKTGHKPIRDNQHGVMHHVTVMFSRSIPTENIEAIHKQYLFIENQPGVNVLQTWYPSIWKPKPNFVVQSTRPTLKAIEKRFDLQVSEENSHIRFDSIYPEFAERFGNKNRYANVIRIRDWGFDSQIATTLPTEYRYPQFSPFQRSEGFLPTSEGFVQFPKFKEIQHYWDLKDGTSVIRDWLKLSKIESKPSESGRATQQIIQTLGGSGGVRNIAAAGIVKILNEISRRPINKSMHHQEFLNKINGAVKGDVWREGAADNLIQRNAVELGLELRCSNCSSWSWYSLKQLDHKISCHLCLRMYSFPKIDPGNKENSRWSYRLIGPFALPNYASGGYSASLAIRFFSGLNGVGDSDVTWAAGQELTFPNGKAIEADFILWHQRKSYYGLDNPTEIVFGEAKSFGREGSMDPHYVVRRAKNDDVFSNEDVSRMKHLAEAFPGSVIVFATMKEAKDMTKLELMNIKKFALWGRERNLESGKSRAPVILLTGTELFTGHYLQATWHEKGGKHAELSNSVHMHSESLKNLADLTQQLYLDLPSYSDWYRAKWEVKRNRKAQRATI